MILIERIIEQLKKMAAIIQEELAEKQGTIRRAGIDRRSCPESPLPEYAERMTINNVFNR